MKKKNLKVLKLNKKSISHLTQFSITGGGRSGGLSCLDPNPQDPNTRWWSCNTLCIELCKRN